MSELILLFFISFIAATIIPTGSEAVLLGLIKLGNHNNIILFLIATIGNVLGSIVNWFLGMIIHKFKDAKYFPVKKNKLEKAENYYQKFGIWTLLFAWLPIIGDPLTIVAGILRTRLSIFITLVTIGKAFRYFLILLLAG
ncbi:MAG: DedA family protein [Rickettsiales bacterium]|nr:DedA family protein [Rickettsiales bacterium]